MAYCLLCLIPRRVKYNLGEEMMEVLTLLISVVALVIATIAFQRTGGLKELKRQVDAASSKSGPVRDRTADVLERLERIVRGKEKSSTQE